MEAQDRLDSQEEGFKKLFEEEKTKFIQAYRAKLNQELQTQSEIINERYEYRAHMLSILLTLAQPEGGGYCPRYRDAASLDP